MSKFEKYEKNHPDILKNPKLAESMDKAKKKHRRRRSMIFQSILMAMGVLILTLGLTLAIVLNYDEAVPYICVSCGIVAHALFYILLRATQKELRYNDKKLFWYNKREGSYKFMCGAILRSSHFYQSITYTVFSWLNITICLVRFDNVRLETLPEALTALVLLLIHFIFTGLNIAMSKDVDDLYINNMRGELKQ